MLMSDDFGIVGYKSTPKFGPANIYFERVVRELSPAFILFLFHRHSRDQVLLTQMLTRCILNFFL